MSKEDAIKQIIKIAKNHDLFVFITDKETVETSVDAKIDQLDWEKSIKNLNEFGDFSAILEALST